jgi:hypothetical protein
MNRGALDVQNREVMHVVIFQDQVIMGWLSLLTTPVSFTFRLTITLLSYVLAPVLFIASPVIYLGQVVLYLTLLPLQILIKLEVSDDIEIKAYCIRCHLAPESHIVLTSARHSSIS